MKKTGEDFPCANCGEPVYVPKWKQEKSSTGRFYCDQDCHNEHQKEYMKGHKNPNAEGEYRACVECGQTFWKSPSRNTRFCSPECSNKNEEVRKAKGPAEGQDNPNWKGGISEHYYRKLAEKHLGDQCVECGSEENLDIHHKNGDHSDNRLSNLEIRCRSCHMKEHNRNEDLQSVSIS